MVNIDIVLFVLKESDYNDQKNGVLISHSSTFAQSISVAWGARHWVSCELC